MQPLCKSPVAQKPLKPALETAGYWDEVVQSFFSGTWFPENRSSSGFDTKKLFTGNTSLTVNNINVCYSQYFWKSLCISPGYRAKGPSPLDLPFWYKKTPHLNMPFPLLRPEPFALYFLPKPLKVNSFSLIRADSESVIGNSKRGVSIRAALLQHCPF